MHAPLLHPQEDARQATLDGLGILDSLPEAFSNAVSTAAAAIANVPISAISLIDRDRQWFMANCGLDVAETPRSVSFCAHAILQPQPLLIGDAHVDPRFQDNPLVTGPPYIRAYAGVPLLVDGHPVGAMCVIDDRPREWTADVVERLRILAAGTSAWLAERRGLVGALRRTEQQLQYVTFTERVTGLPNRLVFQDRLKHAAARCDRSGESLAVFYIDIDGFRTHSVVDGQHQDETLLREVAIRLQRAARASDTVACLGGDHFVVLAERGDGTEATARLASEIAESLRHCVCGEALTPLTASIGIAVYPVDGSVARMISNASAARILARRVGGNTFRFSESEMNDKAHERRALVTALRQAAGAEQLELQYQPKIHAASGQVSGVEALLRWHHPERGSISPAIFIPIAEASGLIDALGHWVIVEACRQMQAWCQLGLRMRVAINVSVHQLLRPDLPAEIATELSRLGVDPTLLTCEITESAAMEDAITASRIIHRLRDIGVLISIDDFGTGYSSLSQLRKMSVNQLKLDRSFVTDLEQSDDARVVASAIIDLAHALRLEVVAEGVETQGQKSLLLGMGCDKFQGFLFARPMSAAAFTEWAMRHDARGIMFRDSVFADEDPGIPGMPAQ